MPDVAAGGTGPADRAARHRAEPVGKGARGVRAALAATCVLVAGALTAALLLVGPHGLLDGVPPGRAAASGPPSAAQAAPVADTARVAALQELLDARSRALLARDRPGWLAATAPGLDARADAYAERQGAVFDRLGAVPLQSWSWEYSGRGPDLAPDRAVALPEGSWVAEVVLSYRLDGVDAAPVRQTQHVTLVPREQGWAVATDDDAATAPQLWDLGPVAVVRSERALLVGTADEEVLRRYAPMAEAAAERVDAVWGTAWPRTTVFLVPATQAELARLLGRADESGLDQIAAVTTGELVGDQGATEGDHVVVNPAGFALLAPLGQQVVLTHELTHVATRASAGRAVPLWLSEGFADWVAYRGTDLPRSVVAAELLEQVRASGPPAGLPSEADFDPARTDVGPAYGGAWLAADLLAQRRGPQALVDAYRRASAPPPAAGTGAAGTRAAGTGAGGDADAALEAALQDVLGTDREALVQEWRACLRDLAGEGRDAAG